MTTPPPRKKHDTGLVAPDIQARWFARVRKAHQTETTEDYVELIADLIEVQKEARLSDLAARLGVSHPTANKVVARLKEEGYIESEPYRSIFLTRKGKNWPENAKKDTRSFSIFSFALALIPKRPNMTPKGSNTISATRRCKLCVISKSPKP